MTRVLDGALGTLLEAQGMQLPAPAWSAWAVAHQPERVRAVHDAYARAVALARAAVPAGHRVWGSLAPVEDCWHPERSPADAGRHHLAQARRLADAGVDGILVETFAHLGEAVQATRAASRTGLPLWVALTPGPSGFLLTPDALADGARRVADEGAEIVLINCLPAHDAERWLGPLARTVPRWGVYANGGLPGAACAHGTPGGSVAYAAHAARWIRAGAEVVGGCCGTGPEHIRAIVEHLHAEG